MAKEDFCFTYYDGDAARDKAHLNRLERGAYDDIISAQRKFGHLTIAHIRKVLSSDFDSCWEALEWILKTDSEGKYFIDWVDESVNKKKAHSNHQAENGKEGGRPPKEFYVFKNRIENTIDIIDLDFEIDILTKTQNQERNQENPDEKKLSLYKHCLRFLVQLKNLKTKIETKNEPKHEPKKKPLENGYENEIEDNKKEESVREEKKEDEAVTPVPQMLETFLQEFPDYPAQPLNDYPSLFDIFTKIAEDKKSPKHSLQQREYVLKRWGELVKFASTDKWYQTRSITDLSNKWQTFIQAFNQSKNATSKGNGTSSGSKGDERKERAVTWVNR